MIQKLLELVEVQFYTVFIIGLIVISFLTIGMLLRRVKAGIIPALFTFVYAFGFVYTIYNRWKYDGKLELYLAIFMLGAFIYNLIIYVLVVLNRFKYNSIMKETPSIENSIYAYLDSKGKVIFFTDEFLKLFNVRNSKELKETITYINNGETKYTLKEFNKSLSEEKEADYKLIFELSNSKEMKLPIQKRKIIKDGKLLGYVLLNSRTRPAPADESKAVSINILNLVSEAIAIYESETNKFTLNKKMQTLIGANEVTDFDEYIFFEDRRQIEKRAKAEGAKSKIYYRINTPTSYAWVVESIYIINGKMTKVIKETDFKNLVYNFRDFSKLVSELDQLLVTQNNFVLAYISLDSLGTIKDKIGKPATNVIATQYFGALNSEVKDLKVFELGYYKYAFFIKNDEVYNNILRGLHNNNSGLIKAKVPFNDSVYEIKAYVGFVERKNVVNPTSASMIEFAEDALKLASNKNYNKDYSIYFSKKKEIESDLQNIDLSDDFLDKILK